MMEKYFLTCPQDGYITTFESATTSPGGNI